MPRSQLEPAAGTKGAGAQGAARLVRARSRRSNRRRQAPMLSSPAWARCASMRSRRGKEEHTAVRTKGWRTDVGVSAVLAERTEECGRGHPRRERKQLSSPNRRTTVPLRTFGDVGGASSSARAERLDYSEADSNSGGAGGKVRGLLRKLWFVQRHWSVSGGAELALAASIQERLFPGGCQSTARPRRAKTPRAAVRRRLIRRDRHGDRTGRGSYCSAARSLGQRAAGVALNEPHAGDVARARGRSAHPGRTRRADQRSALRRFPLQQIRHRHPARNRPLNRQWPLRQRRTQRVHTAARRRRDGGCGRNRLPSDDSATC